MSEPLLKIYNNHVPGCGDPPIIDSESGNNYIGYFENSFGEQWIFTFDLDTDTAILRGGDVGWNQTFDVTDGAKIGLSLGHDEQLWLQACLKAIRRRRPV